MFVFWQFLHITEISLEWEMRLLQGFPFVGNKQGDSYVRATSQSAGECVPAVHILESLGELFRSTSVWASPGVKSELF